MHIILALVTGSVIRWLDSEVSRLRFSFLEIAALAFVLVTSVGERVSVAKECARTGDCQVAVAVGIDAENGSALDCRYVRVGFFLESHVRVRVVRAVAHGVALFVSHSGLFQ
jgi:hypothetical protein